MPDGVRELLAPVLAARTPVERLRAAIDLANHLPVEAFGPWLAAGWFEIQDPVAADVFERILRFRWMTANPRECLDFLMKHDGHPGDEASGWAMRDPQGVAEYWVDRRNPADLELIFSVVVGSDPKIGTGIALAWIDAVGASGWPEKLDNSWGYATASEESRWTAIMISELVDNSPDLVSARSAGWPPELKRVADEKAASRQAWLAAREAAIERRNREPVQEAGPEPVPRKTQTPEEWLAGIATARSYQNIRWSELLAVGGWEGDPVTRAREAFQQLEAEEKVKVATALAAYSHDNSIRELQADAIAYQIGSLPSDLAARDDPGDLIKHACSFASQWAIQDPIAAGRWIRSLPEGTARLWASKNLAARWAEYEPAAARQWVVGLPPAERQEVTEYLDSGDPWK